MSLSQTLSDLRGFLATPLFSVGSTETTLGRALLVGVVVLGTLLVARLVRRLTIRHFERHDAGDEVAVHSAASLVATVVLFIGLEVCFHILGIRLTTLFAAGGLLAVGLGLATKDVIENFISGVILRVDRTIRPGDVVEVHDRWLQIERLGVRSTSGTTGKGEEVMIPNATVAQSTITSLTRRDRLYRVETSLMVPYSADLEQVRRTLEDTVASLEWRSRKEEPTVYLAEFAQFNVAYDILVWIDEVKAARQRHSDLNEALWRSLKKAGIEVVSTLGGSLLVARGARRAHLLRCPPPRSTNSSRAS